MAPEQNHLVRSSFAKVAPIAPAAAAMFYDRPFQLDPELRPLFRGDMEEQGRKLMGMIATVVTNLDSLDTIMPAIRNLRLRHAHGVSDADYDTVAAALLWTLEQGLGSDFDDATRNAWAQCYGTLSAEMKSASAARSADPGLRAQRKIV